MLGRLLRFSSLLTIALATVLAVWCIDLGLSPWIAIAIGVFLPFVIHALPLGVEFITGALIDRRPIGRLNPVDAVRLWLVESWRSFVVFNIDQPWRANFPERPIVNDAARPAVLLVPGYMCNRASWRHWVLDGLPSDWNVATVNLEPVYAPVEDHAESLHVTVQSYSRTAVPNASRLFVTVWAASPLAPICVPRDTIWSRASSRSTLRITAPSSHVMRTAPTAGRCAERATTCVA